MTRRKTNSVGRGVVAVLVVGAVLTAALMWTSWSINRHNENRLLSVQAKQVQAVLTAALPSTQIPLELGAEVAASTGGDVTKFRSYMETQVGTRAGFSYVALWQDEGGSVTEVTTLGTPPTVNSAGQYGSVVRRAFQSPTFVVTELPADKRLYLGFAFALPATGTRFAVYAERPIPADRQSQVAQNSAFSELRYAIYLEK